MYSSDICHSHWSPQKICLTNQPKELEKLSNWLNHLVDWWEIPPRLAFRLDLILVEIVTNIMEHAYGKNSKKEEHIIQIELNYFDHKVTLKIEDDGIPFNPLEHPELEFADNLESAKIGGLGIHLIRQYSNECYYQRIESKNCLELVVYQ